MSNEVTTKKNFQDRMVDKIRESIGDLMTDEELKKIIERGVDQVFFKETTVQEGFHTVSKPPWLCTIVKELLSEKVEKHVNEIINSKSNDVNIMIQNVIQEGIGVAVIKALNNRFQGSLDLLKSDIESDLRNNVF